MSHHLTLTDKILARTIIPLIPEWVTPNYISWMRLCSTPLIGYLLWVHNYTLALPLFFLSAFSDALDGSLARTRDQVTHFGKMFDPLADKLLIAAAAIILIPHYLEWWILIAIIAIDFILIVSAFFRKHFFGTIIQAEKTGKLKMIMQSLGLGALICYAVWNVTWLLLFAQYALYAAIFFALLSLVVYRSI